MERKIMKTVQFLTFFLLVVQIATVYATQQVATLYSNDGRSITLAGRNSPDLGAENFDNIAVAADIRGRWILYENYNYHGGFQIITNSHVDELNYEIKGKVSSIRFVGSSDDHTDNALTLYQGINLQGEEEYTAAGKTLDRSASSLIVSGNAQWTLFFASHFDGDAVCVRSGVVYDTTVLGIPNNAIQALFDNS